jgi:hypothetical protein
VIAAGEALIASGDWQHIATPNQLLVYKRTGGALSVGEREAVAEMVTPPTVKKPARKPAAKRGKK